MKYIKMVTIAAVAAVAVMAVAGTASATTLTSPAGTTLGVGTIIKAKLKEGKAVLAPTPGTFAKIEAGKSEVEIKITNAGSSTTTVQGEIVKLTFTESNCAEDPTVLKNGTGEIHTEVSGTDNGNGQLTSSGTEVTTNCFGLHCIWSTSNTTLGNLTGGNEPILTANATINRTGGRSGAFCGSDGTWTAKYVVESPTPLLVH